MPSLTMAVQSIGLAQVTLETTSAFCGAAAGDQVAPASLVVMTTPLPGSDAPLEPTAMHSVMVGQDTPLSSGVLPPSTCCAFHVTPPLLVASITHHIGPFGYVEMGGRHIHHLVWGILLLLVTGYAEIGEVGTGERPSAIFLSRLLALTYGIGAALTLDEFALWLNLDAAAYWSRQGRESIDAVVIFGALLAIGAWGAPLFRWRVSSGARGKRADRS